MAYASDLPQIRALIASHKRWDLVFACCGALALMSAGGPLRRCFGHGDRRCASPQVGFLHHLPLRPAAKRPPFGLVASCLFMLSGRGGVAARVGAGLYLEDTPKNWFTE